MKKTVFVEDSGLFIEALKGFPGTCSKYVHQRIGLQGLLTLLEKEENRTAYYRSAVAYCEQGKDPISFLGEEKGTIAKEPKGSHGFGHDPLFVPENSTKAYAEYEDCSQRKQFRKKAALQLKEFLMKGK